MYEGDTVLLHATGRQGRSNCKHRMVVTSLPPSLPPQVERFKQRQSWEHALHARFNCFNGDSVTEDDQWGHLQVREGGKEGWEEGMLCVWVEEGEEEGAGKLINKHSLYVLVVAPGDMNLVHGGAIITDDYVIL